MLPSFDQIVAYEKQTANRPFAFQWYQQMFTRRKPLSQSMLHVAERNLLACDGWLARILRRNTDREEMEARCPGPEDMGEERRRHRRLEISLPLEYCPVGSGRDQVVRTTTRNISTGGVYFELDLLDEVAVPRPRSLLSVGLTVPPGDGHSPYDGRLTGVAEVVRCDPLGAPPPAEAGAPTRLGVGARFREPLKLAF